MKIFILIFLPFLLQASTFEALVKRIESPNVVYVSNKDGLRQIRLYGTKAFSNNKQANQNSKNYLASLIGGKTVKVRQITPVSGIIYLDDIIVNLKMVDSGFLLSNVKENNLYFANEQDAKNDKRGNWSLILPVNNYYYTNNYYYGNGRPPNCNGRPCPPPKPPLCNGKPCPPPNCNGQPCPPRPPNCQGNSCQNRPQNGINISFSINGSYQIR